MASNASNELQDIVRRVVENLGNIQPSNSATSSSSSRVEGNRSTTEELNQCFQIPCLPAARSVSNQGQQSYRDLAAGFSSSQNYSSARQPRTRRQLPRSSSGRYQPYNARRGGSNRETHEPACFYKDVCLLPNPSWDRVPRGKIKAFCINQKMYVDAWEVRKEWNEATLRGEIRKLISTILKDEWSRNRVGTVCLTYMFVCCAQIDYAAYKLIVICK